MASADTLNGTRVWIFFPSAQNVLSAPEMGSDSVVYVAQNLGTQRAFNPNGSQRWSTTAALSSTINVSPQNYGALNHSPGNLSGFHQLLPTSKVAKF